MFSIIMPAYNEETHIQKAIDSVLDQRYTDFELIVVDDGSTDRTLQILRNCLDQRLKFIKQTNSGVSAARNAGLRKASYPYILFIDADDYIDPNVLGNLENCIYDDGDAWIYYQKKRRISLNEAEQEMDKERTNTRIKIKNYTRELITQETINSLWGKVYERRIIEENRLLFDEDLLIAEDLLFNLDYLNCLDPNSEIYFADVGYYHYDGTVANSLTSKLDQEKYQSLIKFHDIVRARTYIEKSSIRRALNFIQFKNDYAYLRRLYKNDDHLGFEAQLSEMNQKHYGYFPDTTWLIIHGVVQTKSPELNKKIIKSIGKLVH